MLYLKDLDKEIRQHLSKCKFTYKLMEASGAEDEAQEKKQKLLVSLVICFDSISTDKAVHNRVFELLRWTKDTRQTSGALTITDLRLADADLEKMLELIPASVLEKIWIINLNNNKLTDKGLSLLFSLQLSALKKLGIAGNRCRLDNLSLSIAARLPRLRCLNASNNKISVEKLSEITLAFPELQDLYLASNKPSTLVGPIKDVAILATTSVAEAERSPSLRGIEPVINTPSFQRVNTHVGKTITALSCEENQQLYNEEFHFDQLNHLDLSNSNLTAHNLAYLEKLSLKNLKFLDLSDNVNLRLGFNMVDWSHFKQLETLCLNNCGLNDACLANFAKFFTPNPAGDTSELRYLGFLRNKISQDGLNHLETMFLPKLTQLELYSPNPTAEQKEKIKKLIDKIVSSGETGILGYIRRSFGALTNYNSMGSLIFSRSQIFADATISKEEEQALLNNTHLKQYQGLQDQFKPYKKHFQACDRYHLATTALRHYTA